MQNIQSFLPDKLSRFRGCLLGGAVGDALGFPIEFLNEHEIFRRYGSHGIERLEQAGSPALISDDTQMTLFAANGIILGDVWLAYREWLGTQGDVSRMDPSHPQTWLYGESRLHAWRAPGNTCLAAIRSSRHGGNLLSPVNNSKGCGTVMRAAPFGLSVNAALAHGDGEIGVYKKAVQDAVSTHGHPMAALSSNALAQVVYQITQKGTEPGSRLETVLLHPSVVHAPAAAACEEEFSAGVRRAVELALDNTVRDLEGIHALGKGWVAEEAFYIAAFCAVRYQDDFASAIRASVNHSGDSDSTGAICGNILGAWLGEKAVREAFDLHDLELEEVILAIADDLYKFQEDLIGPQPGTDPVWDQKYRHSANNPTIKGNVPGKDFPSINEVPQKPVSLSGRGYDTPASFKQRPVDYYEFPNGQIVKYVPLNGTPAYDPETREWARAGVFRYQPEHKTWKEDAALTSEFEWDRPYGNVCTHLRQKADISEDLPAPLTLSEIRSLAPGDTFFLGAWPQYGSHDFAPVEWRVLENTDRYVLCISEYCLICSNYCDLEAARNPATGSLEKLEYLTWQKSLARTRCLEFYEDAFSEAEKELLTSKKIPAGFSNVYCEDPVFLLSEQEIRSLLPTPEERQAEPTPSAYYFGARLGWNEEDRKYTSYWLLPEMSKSKMIYPKAVFHNGEIQFHGRNIYHKDFTIRPCILLK